MKIKYKQEEGQNLISCLSEGLIEAPLVYVLALYAEIDLFKAWFPDIEECQTIKELTFNRGLYYL